MFKKKKIKEYLQNNTKPLTAFDKLLNDYIQDVLVNKIEESGISKVEVHIDWMPEYKCIEITGRYRHFIVNIQIESLDYSIAYAEDEADDYATYALDSAESFYKNIQNIISEF